MRLALLNLVVEPWITTADELLEKYWHPRLLGEAIGALGHEVTVLQHFCRPDVVQLDRAEVRFIAAPVDSRKDSRSRGIAAAYAAIGAAAVELAPQSFHLFGTANSQALRLAADISRQGKVPFSVSHHGGGPPLAPANYFATRKNLRCAASVFFPSAERAAAWRRRGLLGRDTRLVVAPELSSPLQPVDRTESRRYFGLSDGIVLAWAARLNTNKDPLTVLRALEAVTGHCPGAELLMAYQSGECLGDVRAYLDARPALRCRVRLLGELDRAGIARLFSAADIFVQASRAEIGGNALVEAMSCGAIPVVSDIPSFRVLTGDGRIGRHFRAGRPELLAAELLDVCSGDISAGRTAVREHFHDSVSYAALARTYEAEFARMGGIATRR